MRLRVVVRQTTKRDNASAMPVSPRFGLPEPSPSRALYPETTRRRLLNGDFIKQSVGQLYYRRNGTSPSPQIFQD